MTTILIIEDQPEMRENLATILEMESYHVLTAENGEKGLSLATIKKPDLILCDVMMPEMDGYTVIERLRENPATSTIPFIFLTAKAEKIDQRTGMNLGADDYLTKPVLAVDLLSSVEARLKRREAFDHVVRQMRNQISSNAQLHNPEPLQELGLTPREAEVLFWVAQGKTNQEVGTILGMSDRTANKHLEHIFEKLGVQNRSAATLTALEFLARRATSS